VNLPISLIGKDWYISRKYEQQMKPFMNGSYRSFEPRDETGIAVSMFGEKLILCDGIPFNNRPIRVLGDVSTVPIDVNKTPEL